MNRRQGFAVLLAVSLATVVITSWATIDSLRKMVASQQWVAHTTTVVGDCESLLYTLADAERESRNYMLTSDASFLGRQDSALKNARSILERLRTETTDNPDQQTRIEFLRGLLERRVVLLNRSASAFQTQGFEAAQRIVQQGEGSQVTDQMASVIALMESEERTLRNIRTSELQTIAKRTTAFALFAGVPAALFAVFLGFLWYRELGARSKVEQQLNATNITLNTVMQKAPIGIFSLDDREAVRFWNPAAESIFGLKAEEVIGRKLATENDERAAQMQKLRETVYLGNAATVEMPWLRRDGKRILVDFSLSPVYGEGGSLNALVGIATDITEKRDSEQRLRYSLVLQQAVLQCAGDGIYGMDMKGRVTFINRAGAEMFGYQESELFGRVIHSLVHHTRANGQPNPAAECPILRSFNEMVVTRIPDDLFWRKDGTSFPVEYVSSPLLIDGQIEGAVVSFRDISERRELERMKSQFVSLVSHELRTPLTSIRGSLGLLASGALGEIPEEALQMLTIAVSNTDRLVRLINDILDLERMDSGRVTMKKETVDLASIIEQSVETVRGAADAANVHLRVESCPASAIGDSDKLIQVFTNLLGNAIKFSTAGSEVVAKLDCSGDVARASVTDTGRGIPEDKLTAVFERFQQVDASDSREKGGSGLGLAIVKMIVEHHGGKVWVESTFGKGSTFIVELPAIPAVQSISPVPLVLLHTASDGKIRQTLQSHGFAVQIVPEPSVLIEKAKKSRPSLILLDLASDLTGTWDTLWTLKADPITTSIPTMIAMLSKGTARESNLSQAEQELMKSIKQLLKPASEAQVLLVEDDIDLARVLQTLFQRDGITIQHAANGREAVQYCNEFLPQLILLDLVLPEMDGFAVVSHLRQHNKLRSVPMVVYSAKDITDAQKEQLKLGTTEFLTKSHATPEDVEKLVLTMLNNRP